jgi:thiosulfate/3-mercaptopyruvate sulfurtransferase
MSYTTLISTGDLARNLENSQFVIFDVRFSLDDEAWGRSAYNQAHIPGAHYADLGTDLSGEIIPGVTGRRPFPTVAVFTKTLSDWGITPDTQVICYDAESGLMAASRLWLMFRWMGHEKVAVLDGGLTAWNRESLPLNQEKKVISPTNFIPNLRNDLLVEVEKVDVARNDSNYCVLDSRGAEGYHGGGKYYDPVRGHIAGAGLADRAEVTDSQGLFKGKSELKSHYEKLTNGVSAENTIFYCGSGVTAAQNVLAMEHAGISGSKMYVGSWSEWITDPSREIAL